MYLDNVVIGWEIFLTKVKVSVIEFNISSHYDKWIKGENRYYKIDENFTFK